VSSQLIRSIDASPAVARSARRMRCNRRARFHVRGDAGVDSTDVLESKRWSRPERCHTAAGRPDLA